MHNNTSTLSLLCAFIGRKATIASLRPNHRQFGAQWVTKHSILHTLLLHLQVFRCSSLHRILVNWPREEETNDGRVAFLHLLQNFSSLVSFEANVSMENFPLVQSRNCCITVKRNVVEPWRGSDPRARRHSTATTIPRQNFQSHWFDAVTMKTLPTDRSLRAERRDLSCVQLNEQRTTYWKRHWSNLATMKISPVSSRCLFCRQWAEESLLLVNVFSMGNVALSAHRCFSPDENNR